MSGAAAHRGHESEEGELFAEFKHKYTRQNPITAALVRGFFGGVNSHLAHISPKNALEVGCGAGFSTEELRRLLSPSTLLMATDVEPVLVDEAQKRNPSVPCQVQSIYDLPYEDNSFEVVFVLEVLEHLERPEEALREVARVSSNWIIASVPREPIWCLLNLCRGKYLSSLGNTPGHIQHWSTRRFQRMLSNVGSVERVVRPIPWSIALCEVSGT